VKKYEMTLDDAKWEFEDFEVFPGVVVLRNCRNDLGEQVFRKLVPVTGVMDIRESKD
jgi:hypothetical protein